MHKYRVLRLDRISPSTLLLSLQPQHPPGLEFLPGQYAAMSFRRHGRKTPVRCFSIASSPLEINNLQFGIKLNGNYTHAILHLRPGDEVYLQGPYGDFNFDPIDDAGVVMLAGGIGITPFISMLRYINQSQLVMPVSLLYSCRDRADVPFAAELAHMAASNRLLDVKYFITQSNENFHKSATSGRITSSDLKKLLTSIHADSTFLLCGPAAFTNAMYSHLIKLGVGPERIKSESFRQGLQLPAAGTRKLSRTYAMAVLSMVLGTGLIMTRDLGRLAASQQTSPITASVQAAAAKPAPHKQTQSAKSTSTPKTTKPVAAPVVQQAYTPPKSSVS